MNATPTTTTTDAAGRPVRLGLRENWLQFTLLVIVNICVGGLVGLERTTVPLIGSETFGLTSDLAVFSFIIAFGLTKAFTNLAAGALTARFRRKQLLVAGWLLGIPVPFVLAYAPSWGWIVAANVLLGLNQGLSWSMTVNMKIDLVGPSRRGLATGLNEAAGYTAVGVTALLTGYLATSYGLRPVPELIGVVFVAAGLALAVLSRHFDRLAQQPPGPSRRPGWGRHACRARAVSSSSARTAVSRVCAGDMGSASDARGRPWRAGRLCRADAVAGAADGSSHAPGDPR
ncbi:MFS transporter [Streptomyces sp. NPDC052299]|uniref:MFS transporter n=1 Tax=Streptomyces sp. NPDC052299 TaxID=3155054 RepID=UPI003419D91E